MLVPVVVFLSPASAAAPRSQQQELLATGCDALVHKVSSIAGDGPVFLQSYEAADSQPLAPALQNAAFVYDNALASIALVACGKPDHARRIADALVLASTMTGTTTTGDCAMRIAPAQPVMIRSNYPDGGTRQRGGGMRMRIRSARPPAMSRGQRSLS